ncbi:MAG: bifunctional methylenetetrahydrofolate dehydrogenase/methenyltetrahydrofolate cyclohydrolase FolD, partial [Deltaproteobacteria bacterium]|nr:bifunctional methylenetetrahydrofolate dehydrogenase/methenyltetrahydrofolate cyclohydrolase FolD [Deltaproteobacteria bacterium]
VAKLKTPPGLATVLVGGDPASQVYVKNKNSACEEAGMVSFHQKFPESISEGELIAHVQKLNDNPKVHGILVQLPLPKQIDSSKILNLVSPEKDVDGFHPVNMGRLVAGQPGLRPCTPFGVMKLIESTGIPIAGKNAVVIGRSNIVGKPVALLLLAANATVTVCHSQTKNLEKIVSEADIVVAAIGKPEFVKGSWIKKGAVVIDVGINRVNGKLIGDVEFAEASRRASHITPVPGGVGPMTIAMLLANTLQAAKNA